MSVQRPLFWHQGVFLQPQHFQLLDRTYQGLLAPYQKFISSWFWGAGDIHIDKGALGTGKFCLMKGEFIFQDGTYVSLPDNAVVESRSFEEDWVEGGRPFTIYLGLRNWEESRENVTELPSLEECSSVSTRFAATVDPEEINDLHGGGPPGQVKMLHFTIKIFWETERELFGDYQVLPIAQLQRFGAEIRLSADFIPPCVSCSASESLVQLVREIRDQVTARCFQLEEHKSRRGVQTAEFGSRDMVYFLALRSMNRYVPLLFHFTEAEHVHPWHIYGILRQLAGELTSFSEQIGVLGEMQDGKQLLPEYDHRALWECFSSAQNLISHLLDEITAGPEYIIRLTHDGTYYASELRPAIFEGRNRFYLAVKTDADPKVVLQSLEDIAKLSSREQMHTLVTQALPGIDLEYLQVPPQELPRRAHTLYFTIDHHDDQWASVEKNRSLALYWNNAPEGADVELMVVGR
jgi:type VI secretion system protein ImpJ